MAAQIIWSPRAIHHLDDLCHYIDHDSPIYAIAFASRIVHIINTLPDNPHSGRIVPEYNNKNLREIIHQGYRIGHEAHFAQVTKKYLQYLEQGKLPDWEVPNMITKYYTTMAIRYTMVLSFGRRNNDY